MQLLLQKRGKMLKLPGNMQSSASLKGCDCDCDRDCDCAFAAGRWLVESCRVGAPTRLTLYKYYCTELNLNWLNGPVVEYKAVGLL
jgi:hypothetical protein